LLPGLAERGQAEQQRRSPQNGVSDSHAGPPFAPNRRARLGRLKMDRSCHVLYLVEKQATSVPQKQPTPGLPVRCIRSPYRRNFWILCPLSSLKVAKDFSTLPCRL
jgi:hypothetical protein